MPPARSELVAQGDPEYPALRRKHPRSARLALCEGDDRAQGRAGDRPGRLAALHALRRADGRAAGHGAGADRLHGRLGSGPRHRRRRAPRGALGRRPIDRRPGQRTLLDLPARTRGTRPRPGRVRCPHLSEMPMRQVPLPGLFPSETESSPGFAGRRGRRSHSPQRLALDRRHAMEQNREVFAVPGPADSLRAAAAIA